MLNSDDKLSGVHGSNRDVLDGNNADWTQSEAFGSQFISLDNQMGAGHLNVSRAVQQFSSGEYDPGVVPSIGWDYHTIGGSGARNEYVFDSDIGGGYLAVTLTWDRRTEHTGGNTYHAGDQFFNQTLEQSLNNLDVYLMPANSDDLVLDAVWSSRTFEDNVEHIFFNNFAPGEYKLVVHHNTVGGIGDSQNYGIAWWFGSGLSSNPGDFNGDGSVNAADYVVWRKNDGSSASYDEWVANFGNTNGSGSTFGSVPEPNTSLLLIIAGVLLAGATSRPSLHNALTSARD